MPETTTPDYSDFTKNEAPSEDKLKQLTNLAAEMREAKVKVEQAEKDLKARQKKLTQLVEHTIPELMTEMNLTDFTTGDGIKLKLMEKIRVGQASSSSNPKALEWLEEHGHSGLIKRTFTILFGREDQKWAKRFAADLKRRKKPLDSKQEAVVHSQTLAAFLMEQSKEGKDVPLEVFNAYRQQYAKLDIKK